MAALFGSETGKTLIENTTVQIGVNNLSHIRSGKSILPFKSNLFHTYYGLMISVSIGNICMSFEIYLSTIMVI